MASTDEPEHSVQIDDQHGTEPGDEGRQVEDERAPPHSCPTGGDDCGDDCGDECDALLSEKLARSSGKAPLIREGDAGTGRSSASLSFDTDAEVPSLGAT